MSTVVKQGAKSAEATKAKTNRVVTPKLICIVTGQSRFTNKEYLDAKAAAAGSRKRFLEHYVCSDAMKLLREGKSVADIRAQLKVKPEDIKDIGTPSQEILKTAMEINGKRAKKVKTPKVAKPAGEKKPAAPRKPKAPAAPKSTPGPSQSTPAAPAASTSTPAEPTTPASNP